MKLCCVMTEIHRGLIIILTPLYMKKLTFKLFRSDRGNSYLRRQLICLQDCLNDSIEASKQKYYSRMNNELNKIEKSSKAYRSILKSFLKSKKIPLIPPLFYENYSITNFKEKAELFISFFADQCSLMSNASKLSYNCALYIDNRLSILLLFHKMIFVKLFEI